jgi:hypothetical protein
VRPGGHVRPRWRSLLPRHTAAYGFEFEADILGGFHGPADGFAHEGRHFDSTLFDI